MTPQEYSSTPLRLARNWPRLVGRRRGYRVGDAIFRRMLPRPGGDGIAQVPMSGYQLGIRPESYIQRLMAYGWFGEESHALLPHLLRSGDRFVDAGAHIGYFSTRAALEVGDGGEVIAIEAHPETFVQLASNLDPLPASTRVVHGALMAQESEEPVALHLEQREIDSCLASGEQAARGRVVEVPTVTFDSLGLNDRPTRLLKIDIEGAEVAALNGAREWLASANRPQFILAEHNPGMLQQQGTSNEKLWSLLSERGYKPYAMKWAAWNKVLIDRISSPPRDEANADYLWAQDEAARPLDQVVVC